MSGRKYEAINLLTLFTESNHVKWNKWLRHCRLNKDVKVLGEVLYGLQAGMTDLVNQKMDTKEIVTTYLRWQKSIDDTLKLIKKDSEPKLGPIDKKDVNSPAWRAKQQGKADLEAFRKKLSF